MVMARETVRVGPFPQGHDRYHDETHPTFQAGGESMPRLVRAMNVDLDDSGRISRRSGLTERVTAATAGVNAYSGAGLLLLQDGGKILLVNTSNWTTSELVTGLNANLTVEFHTHANQVWWTNSEACGAITSAGAETHWGLTVPPTPDLTAVAGALMPGRYQVACTVEDANGMESGTGKAALITLGTTGGIEVDLSATDSNATHVNVYATEEDQDSADLMWCERIAVGSLPATLTALPDVEESTRPLRTQFMRGPVPADGIFSFMGWLLLYRDNELFRNNGLSPHLFHVKQQVRVFPDNILGGVGLDGGFWLVTAKGAWFTAYAEPERWAPMKKDELAYAKGGKAVSGSMFPQLETTSLIALFVSESGWMAGMPDGRMLPLTHKRKHFDVTGKRASIIAKGDDTPMCVLA